MECDSFYKKKFLAFMEVSLCKPWILVSVDLPENDRKYFSNFESEIWQVLPVQQNETKLWNIVLALSQNDAIIIIAFVVPYSFSGRLNQVKHVILINIVWATCPIVPIYYCHWYNRYCMYWMCGIYNINSINSIVHSWDLSILSRTTFPKNFNLISHIIRSWTIYCWCHNKIDLKYFITYSNSRVEQ